jgi:hypothetical protein
VVRRFVGGDTRLLRTGDRRAIWCMFVVQNIHRELSYSTRVGAT